MPKRKRAVHGADTPGRQAETGTCSWASTSIYQNTTLKNSRQPGRIERLLSHGAENAVPLSHLVAMTELPARQVRQQIQAERLQGAQILADNQNGYFLPNSQADVELFYRSMLHRAAEIARVANTVRLRGRLID